MSVDDPVSMPASTNETHDKMRARAAAAGLRNVHVFAFRDRDDPDAGGSEEHAYWVCRHLAASGLSVVLHTGAVRGSAEEVERDGFRVVRRGGRLGVFATSPLDKWRGRLGPCDGIIEIFHGVPLFAPLWSRKPQVGFVHHVHLGTWQLLLPGLLGRMGDLLERRAVPIVYRSRALVTPSRSARDEVIRGYRATPSRVAVAPNGVAERFGPGDGAVDDALVVAVARLMPQKQIDRLIRLLAVVRSRVPTAKAVIVGDGPERARLETFASELGCDGWLRFTGRLNDQEVIDWYRRARLVASTSLREGFGLTLLEAAACGTPAVATRIPGHVDAVDDGVSGLLATDDDALVDNIVRLLSDDELRARLSAGALTHAHQFTWEAATAVILESLCTEVERSRQNAPRHIARLRPCRR